MRFILGLVLLLLSIWLYNSQTSDHSLQRNSCVAASVSETMASLLLSPLSLYSWFTSTLLRLVLWFPALLLTSVHHSLLLLLAWPCSLLSVCASLFLAGLRVALYLLHLALALAAVLVLTVMETRETLQTRSRLKLFVFRGVQRG